jgi:hypothetical protein
MSFFDGLKPRGRAKFAVREGPEWEEPPKGVVPAISSQSATLLRSDDFALVIDRFLVYPNGVSFRLGLLSRLWREDLLFPLSRGMRMGPGHTSDPLQFGCEFSDGTLWTNMDQQPRRPGDDVVGPLVSGGSGGGGVGRRWFGDYWIWPLPPVGSISFFAQWLSEGFIEQKVEISADELRSLSAKAEVLWS